MSYNFIINKHLFVTIDRIEGDYAVFNIGGTEVLWPKKSLPKSAGEGSVLSIAIKLDERAQKQRLRSVKTILSEIIEKN